MEQQVRRLAKKKLIIMILRLDDQLYGFLPHLLGDLIDPLAKKPGDIRALRIPFLPPLCDDLL